MAAVENIVNGIATQENIWAINTEMDYHEAKAAEKSSTQIETRSPASIDTGRATQTEQWIT
jgi:hypothetical protein